MRWNCPHCSIELYLDDGRIGNGWSFARCYRCGGFSLVRKSNVSTIRIDQAPTPETVLQPKASLPTISAPARSAVAGAIEHFQQTQAQLGAIEKERPQVIPGRRTQPPTETTQDKIKNLVTTATVPRAFAGRSLPEPLPETPAGGIRRRGMGIIPMALGITAVLITGAGAFLYLQGQQMWDHARAGLGPETDGVQVAASAPERRPAGLKTLLKPKKLDKDATVFTDRITHGSMAPDRTMGPGAVTPASAVNGAEASPAAAAAHEQASDDSVSDGVPARMVVRPNRSGAKLRMGPGTRFPVVGKADPTITYTVIAWKDQWFKVLPDTGPNDEAWIRNDFVSRVSDATETE
ncbi:MAG TPA: SH3 domain-containing protein [Bdellovibrionota bacterium]|jgi:hypothetical protein|nr:SH3 domain-containing protein [Bdellovibrionota bacterium]